jgi:hypothetical protein
MSAIAQAFTMETRVALSRPSRLGTRRRRAPQGRAALGEAGASRSAERRAPSLDTEKQLATTVKEWNESQKTDGELYREQEALRRQLNSSVHKIWQDHAAAGHVEAAAKWEKVWLQIHNCQSEWIGYRASCCGARTTPIAVPIGCNHRLCPVCAWHRSKVARVRIKTMFDRLTHPVLITLTIPNKDSIRKHDFTLFRQRVRKFIAQHKQWIKGGVYSLETTYNRQEKTWHIHCHILADVAASLPSKTEKIMLAGEKTYAFTAIKLRLEFDWMRICTVGWGKKAKKNASKMRQEGDVYDFESWVADGRQMRMKEWRNGGYQAIQASSAVLAARTKWNAKNRRVVDVRPVLDRDGAAREVLKYITKVADFSDLPEAIEVFCDAVRGARLIQTFGTWYGVKLDTVFDPEHMDDWGEMKCACGLNCWERMGVFYRRDVEMDKEGRWHLKRSIKHTCRGTVPRPTIRALDAPPEESDEELCQMELR